MTSRPVAASRLPVGSSASSSCGLGNKCAGDCDALLLAARQLPGIMAQAMAEADRGESVCGGGERIAAAAELQRDRDVFERRHRRDQVEGLEDDADPRRGAAGRARPRRACRDRCRRSRTRPALGRSSPPSTIIKVDLPEPDGPTTLTVSPAPISSEMPRRMLTGPAALPRVRWTSCSTTSGPPG